MSIQAIYDAYRSTNIDPKVYEKYNVKRGLRNPDGSGVLAGVTGICNVHGYVVDDGEKKPAEGKLVFRGYDIRDLIGRAAAEERFRQVAILKDGHFDTAEEFDAETIGMLKRNGITEVEIRLMKEELARYSQG